VAEPLYVLADTAVVGHLGTTQLAGLAVATSVILAGYALFIFLAYGTTAAVSRLLGAGDVGAAAGQAVQSLWLAAGIGVVLAGAGWVAAPALVGALGATGDVREGALLYLRVSLPGIPALLLTLAGVGYLRGLQDTTTPLAVAAASAAGNLVLEVVLIYGLGLGLGASALATVVAQWGAAAVYLVRIGRAVRRLGVGLRPEPAAIARLAAVGGALLVRTAALRASITVATAVATRLGTVDVAAHAIAFELWNLLALVLDAVAIAGQAITGRLLGAGRVGEARAAGRRMIEWGVLSGVVLGLAVAVLRPVLPGVFTDDPAVAGLAAFLLWWVAVMQPVNGVTFVLDGILIGAGDLRFLAVAMVGAAAAFVPLALAVPALGLGIGWLWGALVVLMVARATTLLARFATPAWSVPGAVRAS
jgi:putative MATE family efflux protein